MGSFRPAAIRPRLHDHRYFTESLFETALKSLRFSCASELTRQGISLMLFHMSPYGMDYIFIQQKLLDIWRIVSEDSLSK